MLTIKHIDRDGSERIFTAETVHFVPDDGSQEAFGTAGLYCDEERDPAGHVSSCSHIIPVCRSGSTEDKAVPTAYVMNRFGATVAKYEMRPAYGGHCQAAAAQLVA